LMKVHGIAGTAPLPPIYCAGWITWQLRIQAWRQWTIHCGKSWQRPGRAKWTFLLRELSIRSTPGWE
jgi:hypothetical protein